jgi:hypothetical protein
VDRDPKAGVVVPGEYAVFRDSQLSFWTGNAEGGTIEAIKENPHVALMFRSQSVPLLQFIGRAPITNSPAERDRTFDLAAEKESPSDPERKGHAVIVDLDELLPPEILAIDAIATATNGPLAACTGRA